MRIVICLVVFLLTTFTPVRAAIVLNEISPRGETEWVELYNSGEEIVDLTGWSVVDDDTSQIDIAVTGTIGAHEYRVVMHDKGWLADSGDYVAIIASSSAVVDSYTYSGSTDGASIARVPDAVGEWDENVIPSQGLRNPDPFPSIIPSPSLIPSPNPSPSPSKSPSPVPSPSLSPVRSPTPPPVVLLASPPFSPIESNEDKTGTVAGTTDIDLSAFGGSPSPMTSHIPVRDSPELAVNTHRLKVVLSVGSGLIMLTASCMILIKKKMKRTLPAV